MLGHTNVVSLTHYSYAKRFAATRSLWRSRRLGDAACVQIAEWQCRREFAGRPSFREMAALNLRLRDAGAARPAAVPSPPARAPEAS